MNKLGIIITDDNYYKFLSQKNVNFINNVISKCFSFNYNDNKIYIYNDKKIINQFNLKQIIGKGTFNTIYLISDDKNNYFVIRKPHLVNDTSEFLINNFIEVFIHTFLYDKQKKGFDNIIKIYYVGFENNKSNHISVIMDKIDGTLYGILISNQVEFKYKLQILKMALIKITKLLIYLQKEFKFVHNDLKLDNIFFKFINGKYYFYIGDFDSSRIEINNHLIIGNTLFEPNKNFNYKKDLFMLIHSLYFSFNSYEWNDYFFRHFQLIKNVANNQANYYKLYYYEDNQISDIYEPNKFLAIIKKLIN